MGGACNEMENAYKILVGKTEGKRQLGRSRRRWEDNIGKDLRGARGRLWTGFIWFRIGTSNELL
jgi:hypothetical protein